MSVILMVLFRIEATNLHWMDDAIDDPDDLCLHGDAVAYIGERKLEYEECTISATALYLLKTLTEDHIIDRDNQMLPCCGFTLIADEAHENVAISGCPNGIDWTVMHDGDIIRLILDDGYEARISISDYQSEVFRFADFIESYYRSCPPKLIPSNHFDRVGYLSFWNEWNRRRIQTQPNS